MTVTDHVHDVCDDLAGLESAVDRVLAADGVGTPGAVLAERVRCLQRVATKVAAAQLTVTAAFDASGHWSLAGHRQAAVWVKHELRLPRATASGRCRLARRLRSLPVTAEALAAGAISEDHARVLAQHCTARLAGHLREAEATLVGYAKAMSFADFEIAVKTWRNVVDPDGADKSSAERYAKRHLHASASFDGDVHIDGQLDPFAGAELISELDRLERAEFESDWADARRIHGTNATKAHLARTPAQRRADALVEMARRSATVTNPAIPPTWTLNLLMDWPTFCAELARCEGNPVPYPADRNCEIEGGTVVTPADALSAAVAGRVRRIVIAGDGHVLDFGRSKRLFTGALREAIILRDRTCTHAGCDVPARKCEIDHRKRWRHGGTTSERDGRARCDYHNHWRERNSDD